MNKKAFTLIELLGVLIILAILTLMIVPLMNNLIKNSSESANKRSVDLYAESIKNAISKYEAENTILVPTGLYKVSDDGLTLSNGDVVINLSLERNKVVCDYVEVKSNGTVLLNMCKIDGEYVMNGDNYYSP